MVSQTFEWKEGGHNVVLTGDFINWTQDLVAEQGEDGVFRAKLERAPGTKIVFKFVVDGDWRNATNYPTEADESGNQNNFFVFPEEVIVDDVPAQVVSAGSIPDVISNSAGIVVHPQAEETVVVSQPINVAAPEEHQPEIPKTEEPATAEPVEVSQPQTIDEPSIATVDEVEGHPQIVESVPEKVAEREVVQPAQIEEPKEPTHVEPQHPIEAVPDAGPIVPAHEPEIEDLSTAEILPPTAVPIPEPVHDHKLDHVTTSVNPNTSAPMLDTPEIEPFTVPFTTTSSDGQIVDEPGDVHVITKEVKTTIIEAPTIEEAVKAYDQEIPETSTTVIEKPVVESTRESSVASLPPVEATPALPAADVSPAVEHVPVDEHKPVIAEAEATSIVAPTPALVPTPAAEVKTPDNVPEKHVPVDEHKPVIEAEATSIGAPTPALVPTPAAEVKTPDNVPETPATEAKPAAVEPAPAAVDPTHVASAKPDVPTAEPEAVAPAAPERTTSAGEEAKVEAPKPSIETTHSNTSTSKVASPSASSPTKKPGFWKKLKTMFK